MADLNSEIWAQALQRALARWDVTVTREALEDFDVYLRELNLWNAKLNLTALREPEHVALGHFVDSIAPLMLDAVFKAKSGRVIDIGSGAGFPGLPLRIMKPTWRLTLLESINKKCDFLRALTGSMELTHVEVACTRAEELGHDRDHREKYDFAFARALSNLSTLIEYGLPFLRIGGYLVAHRGRTAADEATRSKTALEELGAEVTGIHHYEIAGLAGARALVVIQKARPTTRHYPRRTGVAAKRPL